MAIPARRNGHPRPATDADNIGWSSIRAARLVCVIHRWSATLFDCTRTARLDLLCVEHMMTDSSNGIIEVAIADIRIGQRHRKDMGDLAPLAESIDVDSLLQPIVLTPGHELIAGERRIEAFKMLGREKIPAHIVNIDSIVRGEFVENAMRKSLTVSEQVDIGADLEAALGERQGERTDLRHRDTCPEVANGRTRDLVGKHAGFGSGKSYDRAKAVVAAGRRDPEKYGWLVEYMDRTGKAGGAYKRLQVEVKAEAIQCEPPPLPEGLFRVIVVDPPWQYDRAGLNRRGAAPYPEMSLDEIAALDVTEWAAPDCVLWLWTTHAHLEYAFGILRGWGFTYQTTLTWVKDRMGLGNWLRSQTEYCLLATRGKPTITLTNQTTALHAPGRAHSQKPDEFFELVESLCPAPPKGRLELFQRTPRLGWVGHGDEVRTA